MKQGSDDLNSFKAFIGDLQSRKVEREAAYVLLVGAIAVAGLVCIAGQVLACIVLIAAAEAASEDYDNKVEAYNNQLIGTRISFYSGGWGPEAYDKYRQKGKGDLCPKSGCGYK